MRGLLLILGVLATALFALTVGAGEVPLSRILTVLWHGGYAREDLLVLTVRLPRVLAGLAVGAGLAAAGAMMQAVTRNPLADPGLLGVNAGAALAVVLMLTLGPGGGRGSYVIAAFAGAFLAAAATHALGSAGRRGATPLRLTLAGVVVGSFLAAATAALLIFDAATLDAVRVWTAGSLAGQQMAQVRAVLPWIGVGLTAALVTRRQVGVMALGDDVARGLGMNLRLWWMLAVAILAVLAGSAVALAGPVGFVGLLVPHAVRLAAGTSYGRGLPLVMLGGAGLVVLADTLPRAVIGRDLPVGVALAVIGAPVLIALARTQAGRMA